MELIEKSFVQMEQIRRGEFEIMGLYNRFCKRFFAAVIVRTTAQADSRALVLYGYTILRATILIYYKYNIGT